MYISHIDLNRDDLLYATLRWDGGTKSDKIDMDLMAIILDKKGNFINERDLVFYNNHSCKNGALFHTMDHKAAIGTIAKESILVNLSRLPGYCKYVRFIALKRCKKNAPVQITMSIGKMDQLFDIEGEDFFSINFINTNFEVCYLFEIVKTYDKFKLNISLKSCEASLEKIMGRYGIVSKPI